MYSLDFIISIGYRVKSKNGILFRKWANSVLKEYLRKGYVINENRTLITNENYAKLINKVETMDERLINVENTLVVKIYQQKEYFIMVRFMTHTLSFNKYLNKQIMK